MKGVKEKGGRDWIEKAVQIMFSYIATQTIHDMGSSFPRDLLMMFAKEIHLLPDIPLSLKTPAAAAPESNILTLHANTQK